MEPLGGRCFKLLEIIVTLLAGRWLGYGSGNHFHLFTFSIGCFRLYAFFSDVLFYDTELICCDSLML